jgi:hypothetical protein
MRLDRPDLIISAPERTTKKTIKYVFTRSLIAVGVAILISVLIN